MQLRIPGKRYIGKLAKKHPRIYDGLGAMVILLGALTFAQAHNTAQLWTHGAHRLQTDIEYDITPAVERAVEGSSTIAFYNLNFGNDDHNSYDREELEAYFNRALWSLGINARVDYRDVNPNDALQDRVDRLYGDCDISWAEESIQEKIQRKCDEFESAVRMSTVNQNSPSSIVDNYLREILGPDKYCVLQYDGGVSISPRADVGIVVADFKDNGNNDGAAWSSYALIDKKKDGRIPSDQKSISAKSLHEFLHLLGVNHSSYWPFGIMSYDPLFREVAERVPQIAIGPETWIEWKHIKHKYKEEKNTETSI